MEGFDYEAARARLDIPSGFRVEAMAALGKPGTQEKLPKELQEKESPSGRKDLGLIVCDGSWKFDSKAVHGTLS